MYLETILKSCLSAGRSSVESYSLPEKVSDWPEELQDELQIWAKQVVADDNPLETALADAEWAIRDSWKRGRGKLI